MWQMSKCRIWVRENWPNQVGIIYRCSNRWVQPSLEQLGCHGSWSSCRGRSWDGLAGRGEGVDKELECCQDQDPGCAPRRRGAVLDWERWWAAARLFQDACIISAPAAAPTFAPWSLHLQADHEHTNTNPRRFKLDC
jgi:hypothetical protein